MCPGGQSGVPVDSNHPSRVTCSVCGYPLITLFLTRVCDYCDGLVVDEEDIVTETQDDIVDDDITNTPWYHPFFQP
jgi:hypothetical protein